MGWIKFILVFVLLTHAAMAIKSHDGSLINSFGIDDSAFVSQNVPLEMLPGQEYEISIAMQNTGKTSWSRSMKYSLSALTADHWGIDEVELPRTIYPKNIEEFVFLVKAPEKQGEYGFSWQITRDKKLIGEPSLHLEITVAAESGREYLSDEIQDSSEEPVKETELAEEEIELNKETLKQEKANEVYETEPNQDESNEVVEDNDEEIIVKIESLSEPAPPITGRVSAETETQSFGVFYAAFFSFMLAVAIGVLIVLIKLD